MLKANISGWWWLFGIPTMFLLLGVMGFIHQKYTVPILCDLQEVNSKKMNFWRKICLNLGIVLVTFFYIILSLYSIAFIVNLTLEARFSGVGCVFYVLHCVLPVICNIVLKNKKGI